MRILQMGDIWVMPLPSLPPSRKLSTVSSTPIFLVIKLIMLVMVMRKLGKWVQVGSCLLSYAITASFFCFL